MADSHSEHESPSRRSEKKHKFFSFRRSSRKSNGSDGDTTATSLPDSGSMPAMPNTPHSRLMVSPGRPEPIPASLSRENSSNMRLHPLRALRADETSVRFDDEPKTSTPARSSTPVRSTTARSVRSNSARRSSDSDSEEELMGDELGSRPARVDGDDCTIRFSLMLNEACEDTPSFRASAEYLDVVFTELDQWLTKFSEKSTRVVDELSRVKDRVNDVIGLFMPGVTHSSIFAQDYTTLLFGRYAEAEQVFWTDVFVQAARNANEVVEMVHRLRSTVLVKYREAREFYLAALKTHDECLVDLFRLPSNAERAAEREAVHRMHAARRKIVRASTKLVLSVSEVEAECSVSLLETLSEHFMSPDNGFLAHDQERVAISIEFHRLKQAAKTLRKSLPTLSSDLRARRRVILAKIKHHTNLDPISSPAAPGSEARTVRFGWVNAELTPGKWTVLWAFMQHGLFGFLSLSENKTAVVESTKCVAYNSKFEVLMDDDRRCSFRVTSAEGQVITVQASGRHDLELWKQAFAQAGRLTVSRSSSSVYEPGSPKPLLKRSSSGFSLVRKLADEPQEDSPASASRSSGDSSTHGEGSKGCPSKISSSKAGTAKTESSKSDEKSEAKTGLHWRKQDLYPWNPSFAIPESEGDIAPNTGIVVSRIDEMRRDLLNKAGVRYDSTLTSRGAMNFDINIPAVVPLPTSVQLEAVVANSYFQPDYTCNAITANLWGSTGMHLGDMSNATVAERHNGFPQYPDNYASTLVYQDMDMRCMVAQLPQEFGMASDEVMLAIVRGLMMYGNAEVPVRLYMTNHRLLLYGAWRGIVSLSCYAMDSVLDVEASHGVDYSTLHVSVQKSANGELESGEVARLEFKLFIDSAVLAKRKLDYIKDNSRSADPQGCYDILDALAVISIEHGENLKRHEQKLVEGMRSWPHHEGPLANKKDDSAGQTNKFEPRPFVDYALGRPVGAGSYRGEEDALNLGGGMSVKLTEDTYPVSVETLFLIMFGSRSPVFLGVQNGIMDSQCELGPWFRKGKRLERRITEQFSSSIGLTYDDRFNIQRVDKLRPDLVVVSERRSPWQIPTGHQFYMLLRYVIYATSSGSHLQVWSRLTWQGHPGSYQAEKSAEEAMRVGAKAMIMNTRVAAENVHTVEEARSRYGSARPIKVISQPPRENEDDDEVLQPTQVDFRMLLVMFLNLYFRMSKNVRRMFRREAWRLMTVSIPGGGLLAVLFLSILANLLLYTRSRSHYWQAAMERDSVENTIQQLRLSPTQQCSFSRAIYTHEVDDLLSAGTLWQDTSGVGLAHTGQADAEANACSTKFMEIAKMSLGTPDFGALYSFEPQVDLMLGRIADLRLDYALKRNELLTMLTMLNHRELDDLTKEYRGWLINEAHMCANARDVVPILNETVSEQITKYCLSCLQEAKQFY